MRAGAILRFTTSADVSRTEQVKIASVDSATDLTVVRDYGSTTGATLVVGDKVYLTSSPINEKTDAGDEAGQEPDMKFNYTQIYERVASISATAQNVGIYGLEDALDYQVKVKMTEIMTTTIINNLLEAIFNDGGFSNNYAIICAENQARKISALNTSGSNPVVQKVEDDRNLGGYISTFTGDLPVMDGFRAKIVVEPNMLKDQIALVDLNRIEMNWLTGRNLKDMDATLPGGDYFKRRILGEATFTIKNGTTCHGLATGLTV
jgi:hypothetical protein